MLSISRTSDQHVSHITEDPRPGDIQYPSQVPDLGILKISRRFQTERCSVSKVVLYQEIFCNLVPGGICYLGWSLT